MTEATSKPLVFTDTNIWLYTLLANQDANKAETANQLIDQHTGNVAMSSQVVIEIVANLVKKASLDETSLQAIIEESYRNHKVINVDNTTMVEASRLRTRYTLSYWDSLIVAAALQMGASILYSEDMHNGLVIEKQLTIVNPFASQEN
jgi:predicted nucleic acid-binding protein